MSTQLLVGGRIHSSMSPVATAMAVTDGIVVWVGEDRPALALHPDAEIVQLDGAFVTPAFVDTHVHATATGLALDGLDLTDATSVEDALSRLRTFAASSPTGVVWGQNWDESRWPERRAPTTHEIDAAAPGRPVYLSRIDGHSAVASTQLLNAADLRDGAADHGPLTRADHHAVRRAARELLTTTQRGSAHRRALDEAAAHGIAAVHECAGPDITGRSDFTELLSLGHGVEVRGYWGEAVSSADHARDLLADTGAHGLGGDLFVDGSLGSHTAALHEPYADADTCGHRYLDTDAITAHLRACTEAGIQAGFHVIGDAAVTAVVDALRAVVNDVGGPAVASRGHRLEHVEMLSAAQASDLAAWGVIASVQPVFDELWGGPDGLYVTRLGGERGQLLNPFATMASAGVSLAFGSDSPVTPLRPWRAVRAASQHRTAGSAVSVRAAFSAATRGAWRAGGVRDGLAGTLVPGAPASYAVWEAGDLVVAAPADSVQRWSTDPRSRVPALPSLGADEPDPVCLQTVHRGRTVFAR